MPYSEITRAKSFFTHCEDGGAFSSCRHHIREGQSDDPHQSIESISVTNDDRFYVNMLISTKYGSRWNFLAVFRRQTLIGMKHRCPSAPCRRDTTYVSLDARTSPVVDVLPTAPGTGVEVRSAPARVECETDRPLTNLESRNRPGMVLARSVPPRRVKQATACRSFRSILEPDDLETRQTLHWPERRQRQGRWGSCGDRPSVGSCQSAIEKARLSLQAVVLQTGQLLILAGCAIYVFHCSLTQ